VRVIIDGVSYDAPAALTFRERRIVKEVTGLSGIEWLHAVETLDEDVALGYAAVVLHRNGHYAGPDALLDRKVGSVLLDLSEEIAKLQEEETGGPPAVGEAEAQAAASSPAPSS
jgi:hypothetical protein